MREKIIDVLVSNTGTFVSGEELSRDLNISRSAVWKHIEELRQEGYVIEAATRKGYRIMQRPDILHPREINRYLKTVKMGNYMEYFQTIESTNLLAKELAQRGAPEGTVVVAEEQTGGRGRLKNKWFSPRGGIYFSLILRPVVQLHQASLLTLLSAVAVVQAVEEVTGLSAKIKWPNDIFVGTKKLAGILLEMNAEIDLINYVVTGIGINVNISAGDFPSDLAQIAVSLKELLGKEILRPLLLAAVLKRIETLYEKALDKGFGEIITEWKKHDITLGRKLRVDTPDGMLVGKCVGISENGTLLLETEPKQVVNIFAGDVSLIIDEVI